ncbi:hypothetical protein BHQ18_12095 [Mycolicibacterium flavescens]|uniref:Uncharacterized protein n=1 Tax=Mycolicibacterium flavescens TaxID=1776 RepID=A0A1E3RJY6_MYCFV|nr:hypothetical protein BHQ18_12095 [Mycolicibacterium flavescens]
MQALPERMCCRETFELGDQCMVSAQCEVGVDPVIKCHQSELLEARCLGYGERWLTQIFEHPAAPQAQRFAQHSSGPFGIPAPQRLLPCFE